MDDSTWEGLRHVLPLTIPIIAITMGIGIGIVAIILDFRKKQALYEMHHKERLAAIERGMEVPPLPAQFFDNLPRGGWKRSSLRSGLVLTFAGVAIGAALLINGNPGGAAWALVPIAIGLARLLHHRLDPRADGQGSQNGGTSGPGTSSG